MGKNHFADRLLEECRRKRSQVVVGLDPRMELMPEPILQAPRGRTASEAGRCILRFNEAVLEEVRDVAAAVKVQIAFYELYGCEGLRAYCRTLRAARERGLMVIGDVKRNDIGSTASAYACAHLPGDETEEQTVWPESKELHADAITVNPFLGSDGIWPFIERAETSGAGLFVLVKTSNPSGDEIQNLDCEGGLVYERVAALVEKWGAEYRGKSHYSLVGAVAGATFPEELRSLRRQMPHTLLLVPGFGAQGGGVEDVLGAFDNKGEGAVVNSSRGIIYAFRRQPYARKFAPDDWRKAVREAAESMRRSIWDATH